MEQWTVALLAVIVTAAIGIGNFIQNIRLHRQGAEIKVHVDGKLDAAIAEGHANREELAAMHLLVAAMTADHEGKSSPDVVRAAKRALEAAQRTADVTRDAAEASVAVTAAHAEDAREQAPGPPRAPTPG